MNWGIQSKPPDNSNPGWVYWINTRKPIANATAVCVWRLVFAISPLFDAPYLRNVLRYQRNLYIAEKYMGYNSVADNTDLSFIRLAVIASKTREMSRNSNSDQ